MLVGPHASRGFRARESARQRRAYQRRGVFQAFNLTVLAAAFAAHAASGLITAEVGRLVLLALPGTAVGAWLGARGPTVA